MYLTFLDWAHTQNTEGENWKNICASKSKTEEQILHAVNEAARIHNADWKGLTDSPPERRMCTYR